MKRRISLFGYSVITLAIVFTIVKVVIPRVSMWITHWPYPLVVPTTLTVIYMLLAMVGLAIYISMSEQNMEEFLTPIRNFLRGGQPGVKGQARLLALVLIPGLAGWVAYERVAPRIQSPTGIRIQHPTIPGQYEKLINPYREPEEGLVKEFMQKEGLGDIPVEKARAMLVEAAMAEGRGLYQRNCRPCHGSKADGNGPMALGFRLKPANFRDPGTIPTVVEAYVFWRIKEGGRGLPNESTPWDSVMPRWKDELTDDQIWKIIMAEYNTADVEPRKPEKLE
ncbi:MAG: cytochrome c [Nitrospirae bacterium]|nr:cytochrome c [Nitrospirota bacterium]